MLEFVESIFSNLNHSLFQIYSSLTQTETWVIVLIGVAIAAFIAIAVIWGIRAHREPVSVGREDFIGKTAVVKSVLNPKGTVLISGELWTAVLDRGEAQLEEKVVITGIDGLELWVTRRSTSLS